MPIEKSAGAVVFYQSDPGPPGKQIEYLLLLSNFWGFPKGHVEAGESEEQAARREILEEAGLEVTLLDGFREVDDYAYRRREERIRKQSIFFLARAEHRDSKISWEHREMTWLPFAAALKHLNYVRLREILEKANAFLLNHENSRD